MFCFGSLLYLIKAAPSPSLRANPWGQWDEATGHIIIPDHLKASIEKLDHALRGVTDADNVPEELKALNDDMLEDLNNEEREDDDVESTTDDAAESEAE